jgi:C4-dicarboxylate transporter, DctM subunit
MLTILAIGVILLFILGAPVFAVMLALGIIGAASTARGGFIEDFGGQLADVFRLGNSVHADTLSTIPLFILAGYLMAESKTADRMVRFARAMLGWLPGGLAVVTIWACALFTTFSGASGVTIVALGGLIMPALLKEHYPRRFSLGLVAGTGSVGLMFPPALPLFVYGTVYGMADQFITKGQSGFETTRFLFAGIVPGLVLLFILSAFAVVVAVRRKVPRQGFDLRELGNSFVVALPEIAIPFLVIGALASGILVPEIAAITALYVLVIETALYRDLKLRSLWGLVRESMALVGAIFIIIFAAQALTNYLVTAEVPDKLVEWITSHMDSKWTFLLALNVMLIFVGMVMDIFSAIVIVVPLIAPAAHEFGIDPFHLGVIFLLNLEIGYLTPPVGLNLFITSFKFQRPIGEVIRATLPFLAAMILALALVTYIPALTVVPEPERRGTLGTLVALVDEGVERANSVDEVTLPDGTVKRRADCPGNVAGVNRCANLFAEVTECRRKPAAEAADCEQQVIEAFLAAEAVRDLDDDLGLDLDDLDLDGLDGLEGDGDSDSGAGAGDDLDIEL